MAESRDPSVLNSSFTPQVPNMAGAGMQGGGIPGAGVQGAGQPGGFSPGQSQVTPQDHEKVREQKGKGGTVGAALPVCLSVAGVSPFLALVCCGRVICWSLTPLSPQAALIMQVLQLTADQIAMLPPEQRQSILILKEQIQKSTGAP